MKETDERDGVLTRAAQMKEKEKGDKNNNNAGKATRRADD